jgi:hypothetical protein
VRTFTRPLLYRLDGGQRIVTSASDIDPNGVVPIPDFSVGSLFVVIDRLERSTRFQHYILRADELDAVWRHIETALNAARSEGGAGAEIERLEQLRDAVLEAHELVVAGSPLEAAARLRAIAG